MSPEQIAATSLVLLVGSELLTFMPSIRANGWVQLGLGALKGMAASQSKKR